MVPCRWVGNCVGQNNMKYFLQYVLSVFTGGLYAFCLFAYKAAYCYQYGHRSVMVTQSYFCASRCESIGSGLIGLGSSSLRSPSQSRLLLFSFYFEFAVIVCDFLPYEY